MRWRLVCYVVGILVVCIGLGMILPLGFSIYYRDGAVKALIEAAGVTVVLGWALVLAGQGAWSRAPISHREGMSATTLGWVASGIFGGLPFFLSGVLPAPVDCFFEAVSGFTTTGASVMRNVEIVPKGILFWRSLTHWFGGLGIIVLGLAILPFLGVGGMQLYKAEVPGPVPDKLKPRLKDTAAILWKVYILFTAAEVLLLLAGGMDLFDSLCHTFGTMATGGFSTRNASIGDYHSPYFDVVITAFMLLGGMNFALHFQLFRGNPKAMWRDGEWRFFMVWFALVSSVIALGEYGHRYTSVSESYRYAAFQVASIVTTTGYATADFELWTPLSQCLLLLCMIVGGCVGSTGGAVKCMRIIVLAKHAYRELIHLIHPRAITRVKIGRQAVPPEVLSGVWGFFMLYLGLLFLSILLVAATDIDLVTSGTAVLACIGNVGPGLGAVGPMDNYADIPAFAKWVLAADMLLGRLEIYTVLVLLVPRFYRK
jgi:trk system potassium uptake protein TrkH